MNRKAQAYALAALALIGTLLIGACGNPMSPEAPAGEQPGDEPTVIAPPENLVGTLALENGDAAVMKLQFGDAGSRSVSGSGAGSRAASPTSRAIVAAIGTVRYAGEDYSVTGTYDDATGALDVEAVSAAGRKFVFEGVYGEATGFTGTVRLIESDGTTEISRGSVSAAPASDADVDTLTVFLGTFGGPSSGTFNGTLTDASFFGTYSGIVFDGSGSFTIDRSGDTLSGTFGDVEVTGSVTGTSSIGGAWIDLSSPGYQGTWAGLAVDADFDPTPISAGLDSGYVVNLFHQILDSAMNGYLDQIDFETDFSFDTNQLAVGPPKDGVSLTIQNTPSGDDVEYVIWDFDSTDPKTGVAIMGQVRYEPLAYSSNGLATQSAVIIDSDVSNTTRDAGLAMTFPDATSATIFSDFTADSTTGEFSGLNFADAMWDLDATDVVTEAESVFFGASAGAGLPLWLGGTGSIDVQAYEQGQSVSGPETPFASPALMPVVHVAPPINGREVFRLDDNLRLTLDNVPVGEYSIVPVFAPEEYRVQMTVLRETSSAVSLRLAGRKWIGLFFTPDDTSDLASAQLRRRIASSVDLSGLADPGSVFFDDTLVGDNEGATDVITSGAYLPFRTLRSTTPESFLTAADISDTALTGPYSFDLHTNVDNTFRVALADDLATDIETRSEIGTVTATGIDFGQLVTELTSSYDYDLNLIGLSPWKSVKGMLVEFTADGTLNLGWDLGGLSVLVDDIDAAVSTGDLLAYEEAAIAAHNAVFQEMPMLVVGYIGTD